jgi:hypothetical protein
MARVRRVTNRVAGFRAFVAEKSCLGFRIVAGLVLLYVARISKGTVAVLTPAGNLKREIALKGHGADQPRLRRHHGKTVFVTKRRGGFVESFHADRPGEFCFSTCARAKDSC